MLSRDGQLLASSQVASAGLACTCRLLRQLSLLDLSRTVVSKLSWRLDMPLWGHEVTAEAFSALWRLLTTLSLQRWQLGLVYAQEGLAD